MKKAIVFTAIVLLLVCFAYLVQITISIPKNASADSGFLDPSFEIGSTGWVYQSNQGDGVRTDSVARTGSYSANLGYGGADRIASISQQVNVPADRYYVHYFQRLNSTEDCGQSNDTVTVYINGTEIMAYDVCKDLNTGTTWDAQAISLYAYRGQTVLFKMEYTGVDNDLINTLYVDDFAFLSGTYCFQPGANGVAIECRAEPFDPAVALCNSDPDQDNTWVWTLNHPDLNDQVVLHFYKFGEPHWPGFDGHIVNSQSQDENFKYFVYNNDDPGTEPKLLVGEYDYAYIGVSQDAFNAGVEFKLVQRPCGIFATRTPTPTVTPTRTITPTRTATLIRSLTPTRTATPIHSQTPTLTTDPKNTPPHTATPTRTPGDPNYLFAPLIIGAN